MRDKPDSHQVVAMDDLTEAESTDAQREARDARWPGYPIGWCLRFLALIALAGSGYLAMLHWQHGSAGCSSPLGCGHVLNSSWARWLRLPVSYPATLVYTLMLVASFLVGPSSTGPVRRAARFTLVMLATMAAGAALWFLWLLVFVLGKVCIFCLITHSCGLLIGLILLIHPPIHRQRYGWRWLGTLRISMGMPSGKAIKRPDNALTGQAVVVAICLGLLSVSGLIIGQMLFPSPTPSPKRVESPVLGHPSTTGPQAPVSERSAPER